MMVLIQMLTGEVVQGSVFLAGSEVRVAQEIAAPLVEAGKAVFVETGLDTPDGLLNPRLGKKGEEEED